RAGVMEPEPLAARRLDGDRHVLALAEAPLHDPQSMRDQARPAVLRVDDLAASLPSADDAGVADLAARLGVERGAVEDHLHLVTRDRLAPPPPARDHREDPGRRGHRLVAEELALGDVR